MRLKRQMGESDAHAGIFMRFRSDAENPLNLSIPVDCSRKENPSVSRSDCSPAKATFCIGELTNTASRTHHRLGWGWFADANFIS